MTTTDLKIWLAFAFKAKLALSLEFLHLKNYKLIRMNLQHVSSLMQPQLRNCPWDLHHQVNKIVPLVISRTI